MSLSQLSAEYLPAIENELRRVVGDGPGELCDYFVMLHYHLGWADAHGLALPAGNTGKRVRPLLCLLTCAASGGEWQRALPMAAAIELLHNFSLLHDDIQDNSPLRRGRPAVWKQWGIAQAINAGDALFTLAHLAPHALRERGLSAGTTLAALAEFDRTCLALTQGQYLDMSFEERDHVAVEEYLKMIRGKTAVLIAASAKLGALLAGADGERQQHFEQYGLNLGLAFQVHDDALGIWGDPAVTGKSAASDLEKRKKSLPVVYGMEQSDDFVRRYSQTDSASVIELAAQLEALGAREYTLHTAKALTDKAVQHLQAAVPTGPAAAALWELTDSLLRRNA